MRDPQAEKDFFSLMEYLVSEKNVRKRAAKIKMFEMKILNSDDIFADKIEEIKEVFLIDSRRSSNMRSSFV